MANSSCVSDWKNQILSDLQNDEFLLQVMNVSEEEIENGLMYNRFYPFRYIIDRQDVVKSYICVEINIDRNSDRRYGSKIYVRPTITFRIIAHQDDNRITNLNTYKTRLDYIAEIIDKKYNGKSINGSNELELIANAAADVSTTYRERVVIFRGVDIDNNLCIN